MHRRPAHRQCREDEECTASALYACKQPCVLSGDAEREFGGTLPVHSSLPKAQPRLPGEAPSCRKPSHQMAALSVSAKGKKRLPAGVENSARRAGRVAALCGVTGHRCCPPRCPSQPTGVLRAAPRLGHLGARGDRGSSTSHSGVNGSFGLVLGLSDMFGHLLPADYSHHHRLRGQVPADLERAAAGGDVHAHRRLLLRPPCRKRLAGRGAELGHALSPAPGAGGSATATSEGGMHPETSPLWLLRGF